MTGRFFRARVLRGALLGFAALLAACGGSSSDDAPPLPASTAGSAFRAKAGAVVVEYDAAGNERQRSQPTDDGGRFEFEKAVTGLRVQVLRRSTDLRAPALRSARVSTPSSQIELTPVTTLFDQLLSGGMSSTAARQGIGALVGERCGAAAASIAVKGVFANAVIVDPEREWLLRALDAYLVAFRNVGLSSRTPGVDWLGRLRQRGALLGRMCDVARELYSDAWLTATQQQIASQRDDESVVPRVAALRAQAADEVLALMGTQLVAMEFPDVPAATLASRQQWQGNELSLAVQVIEALLDLSPAAAPAAAASSASAPAPAPAPGGDLTASLDRAGAVFRALVGKASGTASSPAALRFENRGSEDRAVRLIVNDRLMADYDGLLDQVLALPAAYDGEPLRQRAWRFVVERSRHSVPISEGAFQHQADLFVRSIGAGYCDDVSSVLAWIWMGLGLETRVIGLGGHVVAEVKVGNRWEMYDADYRVYYYNRSGQVASVDDLANDPALITQPVTPIFAPTDAAYSQLLADIYGSLDDNVVTTWLVIPNPAPLGNVFTIPAGGHLEFVGGATYAMPTIDAATSVALAPVTLWYPPGFTGTIDLPMVLADIQGDAQVSMVGYDLDVPPEGLASFIRSYYLRTLSVGITRVQVDRVGPTGLTLTLLANPFYFAGSTDLTIAAFGPDLSGLAVGAAGTTRR